MECRFVIPGTALLVYCITSQCWVLRGVTVCQRLSQRPCSCPVDQHTSNHMQVSGMPAGTFPNLPKDLTANYYALKPYGLEDHGNNIQLIAGIAAGVCVVLLLAGLIALCFMRRQWSKRRAQKDRLRALQVCSLPQGCAMNKLRGWFLNSLTERNTAGGVTVCILMSLRGCTLYQCPLPCI